MSEPAVFGNLFKGTQGMYGGRAVWVLAGLYTIIVMGCGTGGASRVHPVEINVSSAASSAMEMYDKNGDGALAADELNAVPGIKKYVDHYDKDGDDRVSRDEIVQRLQAWADSRSGLMGRSYMVSLDGQPLSGATVTLGPEPYLGPNVKPASGTTGPTGLVRLSHAEEDLPKSSSGRAIPGVKGGTYKIQVTHPSRTVPPKYNSATELGDEIAFDINTSDVLLQLPLTSR